VFLLWKLQRRKKKRKSGNDVHIVHIVHIVHVSIKGSCFTFLQLEWSKCGGAFVNRMEIQIVISWFVTSEDIPIRHCELEGSKWA
jgi:hypothetical protein